MESAPESKEDDFCHKTNAELNNLLRSLATELTSRLTAADNDRIELQKAQEAARYDARRIASLEREVAYLRSTPHYKDTATQTIDEQPAKPCVDLHFFAGDHSHGDNGESRIVNITEYNRIKSELASKIEDLERVCSARDVLEIKYRQSKRSRDHWEKYFERWMDTKGRKRNKAETGSDHERPSIQAIKATGQTRAASAPTQTLPVDTRRSVKNTMDEPLAKKPITPSPISSNGTSLSQDSIDKVDNHEGKSTNTYLSIDKRVRTVDDNSDLSQTSDEDGEVTASQTGLEAKLQRTRPETGNHYEDSETPVVISVRSLKRKREREQSSGREIAKVRRDDDIPGTASKPVHVKSDASSSSPLAAPRFQGSDDVHDSIDLDELGRQTKTPRKHKYHMLRHRMGLTPSGMRTSDLVSQGHGNILDEDIHGDNQTQDKFQRQSPDPLQDKSGHEGEDNVTRLRHEAQAQHQKSRNSYESCPNEDESSQAELARGPNQAALEEEIPDDTLGMTDRRVDDFNRRIMEAQHQSKGRQQAPRTPQTFQSPAWNVQTHIGIDTRDFGLPTPTTSTRPNLSASRGCPMDKATPNGSIIHSVLQPKDPNNQMLPRTSDLLAHEKRHCPPSRRDRGAAQINTVLEDGEESHSRRQSRKGTLKPTMIAKPNCQQDDSESSSGPHHRLGTLLSEPSPGRPALPVEKLNVPKRTDRERSSKTPPSHAQVQTKNSPLYKPSVTTASPMLDAPTKAQPLLPQTKRPITYSKKATPAALATLDLSSSDEPPPVLPDDEPLRSRPVHRLGREDFKINPAANQGFSHAYREVLRKREERKCLPNCNRADCCGAGIRKSITIGGPLPRQNRGLFQSSPPTDDDNDVRYDYNVLKEYMGYNYHNWSRLSDEQKKKEWEAAEVWDWQNRFGKHKASVRQRTPPGYWAVDFDSTQEAQKQREEAEKIAREEVAERWREAMRPGGRYKFADE